MALVPQYSDDEFVVVVLSCGVSLVAWIAWFRGLRACWKVRQDHAPAIALMGMPLVALALLFVILKSWASFDVRDSGAYLFQYMVMGAAWLGVGLRCAPWLGISARDDAAERGNPAASVALCGAMLGLTLCYAGGNVGDGPGWWVVVFSSGLATVAFLVAWAVLDRGAQVGDSVTIDRDLAAALRFAAFSTAQGLILGRAVAGDWKSAAATLDDLLSRGWPALVVLALALALERALRPTAESPRRSPLLAGIVPGLLLLVGAFAWLAWLGDAT